MDNKNFLAYNDRFTYEVMIAKGVSRGTITDNDVKQIRNFIVEKLAKGKIKERRAARIASMLVQWRRFIAVPYDAMTEADLLTGLHAFQNGSTTYGHPYRQSTKRSMVMLIKTFTRFLIWKKVISPIDADELKEIEPPAETFDSVKPEDILTGLWQGRQADLVEYYA